jgi:hypothetical protein
MMRKVLMPLFLLLFSSMMLAQEYNNVVVTLTDGTRRTISLSEKPIVTIANGKLVIKTDMSTTEFDRANVARFNFVSDLVGIDEISSDDNEVIKDGDNLYFSNLPENSLIKIYTADGSLVKSMTASGAYKISLAEFSAGVYIVSVNGVSTKIAVTR